jgi:hypothetical protein
LQKRREAAAAKRNPKVTYGLPFFANGAAIVSFAPAKYRRGRKIF